MRFRVAQAQPCSHEMATAQPAAQRSLVLPAARQASPLAGRSAGRRNTSGVDLAALVKRQKLGAAIPYFI